MLLKAIVAELPSDGSTMLRVGMTNPPYILEHLKEIADVLCHPCVYSFLHVPVQSGSDRVLSVSCFEPAFSLLMTYLSLSLSHGFFSYDEWCAGNETGVHCKWVQEGSRYIEWTCPWDANCNWYNLRIPWLVGIFATILWSSSIVLLLLGIRYNITAFILQVDI